VILPNSEDLKKYRSYPVTWALVFLNIFIFVFLLGSGDEPLMNSPLLESKSMILSGRLYYQFLQSLPADKLYQRPAWVMQVQAEDLDQIEVLGAYALRDRNFLDQAGNLSFRGDQVQIESWRQDLESFKKISSEQLASRFGLTSLESGPLTWITYQFAHSGWFHLFSNLLFLVVIGVAVENLCGGLAMVILYTLGGLAGGAGFIFMSAHGTVPMVGASASISALLAFYCLAEPRRRIRYLYFISPLPKHFGAIYLPTLLILPLFLVADAASLWAVPEGLGSGVAYSAHLGGAFLGLLLGWGYRYLKQPQKQLLRDF